MVAGIAFEGTGSPVAMAVGMSGATFTFGPAAPGVVVGGVVAGGGVAVGGSAATSASVSRRPCRRYVTLRGSFKHAGKAGANRVRFTGRLRRRKLRRGSYRLRARAVDAAGNRSRVARKRFQIVRR